MSIYRLLVPALAPFIIATSALAAEAAPATAPALPGDGMLAAYFESEITRLEAGSPSAVTTLAAWHAKRATL